MIAQTLTTQNFLARVGLATPANFTPISLAPVASVDEEDDFDREYQQWKREMGLDVPLTDQQVDDVIRYELSRW